MLGILWLVVIGKGNALDFHRLWQIQWNGLFMYSASRVSQKKIGIHFYPIYRSAVMRWELLPDNCENKS